MKERGISTGGVVAVAVVLTVVTVATAVGLHFLLGGAAGGLVGGTQTTTATTTHTTTATTTHTTTTTTTHTLTSTTTTPTHTTTTTTTTTLTTTTFELTGWNVVVSWGEDHTDGWADLECTYSINSPVAVDLIDPNGASMALWSLSGYDILQTSGTSKISMTLGQSNTSPSPGAYRMVVYSLDAYGNPVDEIWENTFTFSGPHISIENAGVSWDYVAGGTYAPSSVAVWVRNTGDLPAFGYYLRAWVGGRPIHIFTGAYYGWINTGGPWFATDNNLQGLFNPGTYSLHIEWVKEPEKSGEEESLAASYDNNAVNVP